MLNAIILAGEQPTKGWNDKVNKALFRINGKMMIEYVIDALKGSGKIGKVIVVGSKRELDNPLKDKADAVIDSKTSIMDDVLAGVGYLGRETQLLVCSCDIPMLTAEAVDDFVSKAGLLQADFCYPIIEKSINDKKYPEIERTYIRLKEGVFTGGNLFYVNPKVIEKGIELVEKVLEFKKNPVKIAKLLGISFMLEYSMGALTIYKIEKRFSEMTNIKARAVISEYPEIGNDVDKPSDVIIATAHLSR